MATAVVDHEAARLKEIRRLQMAAVPREEPRFEGGESEDYSFE